MKFTNQNINKNKKESNFKINQEEAGFNQADNFYNKKQESDLAVDVINSANLLKSKQGNIITDIETKPYSLEEVGNNLADYKNEFKGVQESYAADPKATAAFGALAGSADGVSNNFVNKLTDKMLAEEDEKKNAVLEQSINLAVAGIRADQPDSVFKAIGLTDKYLMAMYGVSKNSEQLDEMRKVKNSKIISSGINKAIEAGDFDAAYDLYGSLTEDSFDEETAATLRESIIAGKRGQVEHDLFERFVAEKSPDDIKAWLDQQTFNIEIGKGANKLLYEPNEEDLNSAVNFIGDSEARRKLQKNEELEANKLVFNEEFMKLVAEGNGTGLQGRILAKKLAQNPEELEAFEGKAAKFREALHNKENQSYKDMVPIKMVHDLTKRLILGKADVEDIDVTRLWVGEAARGLLDLLEEEYVNKAGLGSEGVFAFDWFGMKGDLAEEFRKKFNKKGTTAFDEELFNVVYEGAAGEVIDEVMKLKQSGENVYETEILEKLAEKIEAVDVDGVREKEAEAINSQDNVQLKSAVVRRDESGTGVVSDGLGSGLPGGASGRDSTSGHVDFAESASGTRSDSGYYQNKATDKENDNTKETGGNGGWLNEGISNIGKGDNIHDSTDIGLIDIIVSQIPDEEDINKKGALHLGKEWLTGKGGSYTFGKESHFAQQLFEHESIKTLYQDVENQIKAKESGKYYYSLADSDKIGRLPEDIATMCQGILTGKEIGNPAATYMGSYGTEWKVIERNPDTGMVTVQFKAENTISVGTVRPPVIGYWKPWLEDVEPYTREKLDGKLPPQEIKVEWTETFQM